MKKEVDNFVGREHFLNILNSSIDDIKRGSSENLALIGQKNIGKSFLLKQFIESNKDRSVVPVYINLERTAVTPEEFCLSFVSSTCQAFKGGELKQYKEMDDLLKLDLGKASQLIKDIKNEFEKIKPNYELLVDIAFKFPQVLGAQEKRNVLLIIDEFQNILDLENYKIKNLMSFIKPKENISFIVSGSAIKQMKELCKDFKIVELSYFSFDETKKLINSLIKVSDKEIDRIFKLSLGHPYFISSICDRYEKIKDVDKSFVIETLSKQGLIYNACNSIYNNSLNKARGKTLLMSIMNNLVYGDGLRLSEVSRKIYRQSPVTKNLLSRLIAVDLLVFKENRYYFTDPILKYWLKNILLGSEFNNLPSDSKLNEVVKELE